MLSLLLLLLGLGHSKKFCVCIRVTTCPPPLLLPVQSCLLPLRDFLSTRHNRQPTKFELPRELTFAAEQSACSAPRDLMARVPEQPESLPAPNSNHYHPLSSPAVSCSLGSALFVYLRKSTVSSNQSFRVRNANAGTVGRIAVNSHGLSNSPCPSAAFGAHCWESR